MGLGPRDSAFTEALGQAVCERVAAGMSVLDVGREDGMPEGSTIYKWAKARPEFAAALHAAKASARVARRLAERAVREPLRAAMGATARSRAGLASCRYTPEIGRAICERLANGESLIAICRDDDLPHVATVYNWLAAFPEFEDMYVQARQLQADYLMDEAREVALAATPKTVWADRLRFDAIRWATAKLAPKKYCERIVADIERREPPGEMRIIVCRFERGPNNEVLVIPPRNPKEEAAWERAYGRPYDGPRGQVAPAR